MKTFWIVVGAITVCSAHSAARVEASSVETSLANDATPNSAALSANERARLNRDENASASRLKTLSRAALQLAKANNDRLVLTNRDLARQLQPFLDTKNSKGENANHEYSTDGYSFNGYSFNDNLRRVWTLELQEPENIVLFYEGARRKLRFRATGWSVVAFADGSVRSVTRLQAQKLRWWKDRVLDELI